MVGITLMIWESIPPHNCTWNPFGLVSSGFVCLFLSLWGEGGFGAVGLAILLLMI